MPSSPGLPQPPRTKGLRVPEPPGAAQGPGPAAPGGSAAGPGEQRGRRGAAGPGPRGRNRRQGFSPQLSQLNGAEWPVRVRGQSLSGAINPGSPGRAGGRGWRRGCSGSAPRPARGTPARSACGAGGALPCPCPCPYPCPCPCPCPDPSPSPIPSACPGPDPSPSPLGGAGRARGPER